MVHSGENQDHLLQARVCPVSREKNGQGLGGMDIVSGFKTCGGQLLSIPVNVTMQNGSLRDTAGS